MDEIKKKLPIGIEDFAKLRQDDFYYVDKTKMIKDLLNNWSDVTLFTRPRRFGKSLNMSMLKNFFSPDGDKSIFDNLSISGEARLCQDYMGKYPVISISLKNLDAATDYLLAKELMIAIINDAALKMQYLLESNELTDLDKDIYLKLTKSEMSDAYLMGSLRKLAELLEKHYRQKTIILIDEYDVPLAKAYDYGYYDEMVNLLRGILGQALKTNDSLKLAVLTGCMRISKESIFTGLNNFRVRSVTDAGFDEYFGFTDQEVRELLDYYEVSSCYNIVKEWYDGYRFGNTEVYCPWDVLNYCDSLRVDLMTQPENYWINTSSNAAVRHFIEHSESGMTKREIERLLAGEIILKEIHQELTYKDMYDSIENIWSVLFMTGYLTMKGKPDGSMFRIAIPNTEVRNIFTVQIMEYFKENVKQDGESLQRFCDALENGDAKKVEESLTVYLKKTISIRDTFVQKLQKENFYHGILLGILGMKEKWEIASNREMGDGYSDIVVETENAETGIIIEVKYAHDGDLESTCEKALDQIEDTHYEDDLLDEGIDKILKYGIACYKKRCKVMIKV